MNKLDGIVKNLDEINSSYVKDDMSYHYIDFFVDKDTALLSANSAGLVYLANCLLKLAKEEKNGGHYHLDKNSMLDDGNCNLIFRYKPF